MKREMPKALAIIIAVLALFNLLFFYSLHSMWSGIVAVLGTLSPYFVISIMFIMVVIAVILFFKKERPLILNIILAVLDLFFFGVEMYMLYVCKSDVLYFIREFYLAVISVIIIAFIVFMVFFYYKTPLKDNKVFKYAIVFVLIFAMAITYFDFAFNYFTSTPVVYAVEDEYQIVYTTNAKGTAWVEIDGVTYNDTYAGYRTSEDRVHKITVPMEVLDNAKEYTIYSRNMILRGPYNSLQGRTIQKTYSWRGVDTSDGLNYYIISDTHEYTKAATKASSFFGDDLDFFVVNGDFASFLDRPSDIGILLKLAGNVAKGEVPVIYARGNHETKGLVADQLYKYVGSKDQKFYFTFRLKNVWGIVLDMGEDHADDWVEFYGASKFNDYREEQVEFLQSVIDNKYNEYEAEGVDYRIAFSHITTTAEYREDEYPQYKYAFNEKLNKMKLTAMFSGHRHQIMYIEKDWQEGTELTYAESYRGYVPKRCDMIKTNANFAGVISSRKSYQQEITTEETNFGQVILGLAVSTDFENTTLKVNRSDGVMLDNIKSPWFEKDYGKEIVIPNIK